MIPKLSRHWNLRKNFWLIVSKTDISTVLDIQYSDSLPGKVKVRKQFTLSNEIVILMYDTSCSWEGFLFCFVLLWSITISRMVVVGRELGKGRTGRVGEGDCKTISNTEEKRQRGVGFLPYLPVLKSNHWILHLNLILKVLSFQRHFLLQLGG